MRVSLTLLLASTLCGAFETDKQILLPLEQRQAAKVLRFQCDNPASTQKLIESAKSQSADIWTVSSSRDFFDVMVNPVQEDMLSGMAQNLKCDTKVTIKDVERAIQESKPDDKIFSEKVQQLDLFFENYRSSDSIYAWFDLLEETFPGLVSVEWIGQTYEGRDIKALRVSTQQSTKTVVVTGGIHAREWISTSSVCFVIYKLLDRFQRGKKAENLFLQNLNFLFLPVMNPDGYEYTWSSDRLWRKNRQETYIPRCFGIDIDHSFDYHFQKSDDRPCGEDYSGEEPFEALEARLWNAYLSETSLDQTLVGYIDLHSYSQEVLYPYAYSCDDIPRDEENLMELGYGMSKAIRLDTGKNYKVLRACTDKNVDLLPSLGAGSALDYMYHHRAWWAFQLKLRDTGNHGFLLPSKFIKPVGKEVYSAVRYFCRFVIGDD